MRGKRWQWILVVACVLGAGTASAARQGEGGVALRVDDTLVGFVQSASGGTIRAEVVEEEIPGTPWPLKQVGEVGTTPVSLELGLGQSKPLLDWINAMADGAPVRHDGALLMTDTQGRTVHVREFHDALLTEIGFPALDGSSKDPCTLSLGFQPETVRYLQGGGEKVQGQGAAPASKRWLSSNFRFELGDLPCDRVTKIDGFTLEQRIVRDEVGPGRESRWVPTRIEVPNLRITIGSADAAAWSDWFQSFVIDGHNGPNEEQDGQIVFLAPDRSTELGSVDLHQVGIIGLTPLPPEPGGGKDESAARVEVEVYVEHMHFRIP